MNEVYIPDDEMINSTDGAELPEQLEAFRDNIHQKLGTSTKLRIRLKSAYLNSKVDQSDTSESDTSESDASEKDLLRRRLLKEFE